MSWRRTCRRRGDWGRKEGREGGGEKEEEEREEQEEWEGGEGRMGHLAIAIRITRRLGSTRREKAKNKKEDRKSRKSKRRGRKEREDPTIVEERDESPRGEEAERVREREG